MDEHHHGRKRRRPEQTDEEKATAARSLLPTVSNVGEFEKHTKGIGKKLFEKMGYKGGGLGKNQQGIVTPIAAKMRPKNMGMGYNDYKEAETTLHVLEEPVEERESFPRARSEQNRNRKKKYAATREELVSRNEDVVREVIDMRGPQVRVLTSLKDLNAEVELKENDNRMRKLDGDNIISTASDMQKKQLDTMLDIHGVIERIRNDDALGTLTIDSLTEAFDDLKRKYTDEYKLCKLSSTACSFASPLLDRAFQGWDPLQNPAHGLELMSSWKNLPEDDALPAYTQLVTKVVFPRIYAAAASTWNPRDPEPMLKILELWESLLPQPVVQSILDNVVVLLSHAVDRWDPRAETVPIHLWIHPWIPLLGEKAAVLHQTIRPRLGNALLAWHPSDGSARVMLSPWKNVFDPASWERLVVRYIVPKLETVLKEFEVNPAAQNLEPFHWVASWASTIPVTHTLKMLERHFFPKWLNVLYHWLRASPKFEEVRRWYLGWKRVFPDELLANDRTRDQFNKGLKMMNQAVQEEEVVHPDAGENVGDPRQIGPRQNAATYAQQEVMSLKEAIEAYAQQNNLLFKPKTGRTHNGFQIYGFGNVSMYVDGASDRIFAQTRDVWSSATLETLKEMHYSSGSKRR